MRIGDGNNPVGSDDLLDRMAEARAEKTGVDATAAADASSRADAATASEATGRAQPPESDALGPLKDRLLATAERALAGAFDSADALRCEVVGVIVDERYGAHLSDGERDEIVQTLQSSLADDPEFKAEVDNMLILAAGHLGRRD